MFKGDKRKAQVPHREKFWARVCHIWANRQGQPRLSAMSGPRSEPTSFLIEVKSLPQVSMPATGDSASTDTFYPNNNLDFLPSLAEPVGPQSRLATQRLPGVTRSGLGTKFLARGPPTGSGKQKVHTNLWRHLLGQLEMQLDKQTWFEIKLVKKKSVFHWVFN